jgi:glycosyltransferase involved in cell wall biosynthesis
VTAKCGGASAGRAAVGACAGAGDVCGDLLARDGAKSRPMINHPLSRQTIAILTNARAGDQRSMIGYGELLLDAARQSGMRVVEWRGASLCSRLPLCGRLRKLALNLDRFVVTPLMLLGRRADIVHVVDPGNCVYLPLTRHRHCIVTVHDLIPYLSAAGRLEGFCPTPTGRLLMAGILRRLARVDHIVCVSHTTRRDLLELSEVEPSRVTVIHNAVFQKMEAAGLEACISFRVSHGIPPDAPLVLHVGRNFYKNRPMVLDVFARVRIEHPDVRLVLVGALEPALLVQASRLGIIEALHVLDFVPREEMAALYTTASVLLFPSLYEGFGLPVLEAHMCGTAVVCSDAGSLPEVAREDEVVASQNVPDGFVEAVGKSLGINGGIMNPCQDSSDWINSHCELYRYILYAV